jgi:hypothetical protein
MRIPDDYPIDMDTAHGFGARSAHLSSFKLTVMNSILTSKLSLKPSMESLTGLPDTQTVRTGMSSGK